MVYNKIVESDPFDYFSYQKYHYSMCIGKLFIVTTFLLTGFFTHSYSQDRASATIGVTIITPIGVTNNMDLSSGNNLNNGSVIITPLLSSSTGDAKIATPSGTVVSAAYSINDQGAYSYAITLPTTVSNGNNILTVTSSKSVYAVKGTGTMSSETLNIGVLLKESGNNTGGITIPITVNYN